MAALRPSFIAIVLLIGLAGSAQAQFVVGGGSSAFPGPGANSGYNAANSGYYSVNSGFGNYGLPGTYPGYQGYGLSGYGPGTNLGGYFIQNVPNRAPQTSNNMGGLVNAIKTQTGRGNSYSNGVNGGVSRRQGRRN